MSDERSYSSESKEQLQMHILQALFAACRSAHGGRSGKQLRKLNVTVRNFVCYSIATASVLLVASCTYSNSLSDLRDVQVSEITLAEPLIAEAKLA